MHSTSQINNGIYYSVGMLELELEMEWEPRRWFSCTDSFAGEPLEIAGSKFTGSSSYSEHQQCSTKK